MDLTVQLEQDRANLVSGLERMQSQYIQLGQRIQQQSGACQYVEMLLERVKAQNGAAPVVEAAPVEGEID